MAAAAAHELGSPLGTIALAAESLAEEIPADDPVREDVDLVKAQTDRCRQILANLARNPSGDGGSPVEELSLAALLRATADSISAGAVDVLVDAAARDSSPAPTLRRSPELTQGLGNLIGNAIQFARRRVSLRGEWSHDSVVITILDDGPGISPAILSRLGQPYVSGRSATAARHHMGLGIFIAVTLLDRIGGQVRFASETSGGTLVTVTLDRHLLEVRTGHGHGNRQ